MRTDVVRADRFRSRAVSPPRVGPTADWRIAVLRGKVDTLTRDTLFSVVSFNNVTRSVAEEDRLRSGAAVRFPSGNEGRRRARAAHLGRSVDDVLRHSRSEKGFGERTNCGRRGPRQLASFRRARRARAARSTSRASIDTPDDNPSLVLWHGKDPRLQSQQIVQEAQDRAFNYLSEYRIVDNKFVRCPTTRCAT